MARKNRVKIGKKTSKNIKNTQKPQNNIINTVAGPEKTRASGFVFDISFSCVYYSISHGRFTNYLKNESHFAEMFRETRKFIHDTGNKNFIKDLIRNSGMAHCHIIEDEKYNDAVAYIKKTVEAEGKTDPETTVEQYVEGEKLYQIGREGGVRYIGTYDEIRSVFHLLLIDYHHRLYSDERRNKYSSRDLKYCVMKGKK